MMALIKKEIRIFMRKRYQFFLLFAVVTVFAVALNSKNLYEFDPYVATSLIGALFVSYGFGWIAFLEEQKNKNISYLLASPLSMREIFLGKILAVYFISVALTIWGLLAGFITSTFSGGGSVPTLEAIIISLIALPIWSGVLSGLLGIGLLVFGNPLIIRMALFLLIYFVALNKQVWIKVSQMGLINYIAVFTGLFLVFGIVYIVGFFSKELIQQ
ncbi:MULTISPECIES: hypothetical protein [Kosmotoga]|jgi:ABC-2 type transport system permease protein|uniref:ABC transporter permease n=1 Tax=Kosmotoga olearia (strain ATCC BAA-1733 / DSM 21960 / TBF 19.5.1) TaxID=521045 RepID=C5CG27_KOSOT|nr:MULTISPECIES: hypothetical protein [Kosmotoga]ACR79468.1 hypothetical protein Kole_0755 [Kosmotoga olearia TBF 19.5.1]MDI3524300.1 type transport system permease protein [Kosmotoga sp.]MDK2954090.1 type transport system permease protein [Kosmotoga sp.]OAA22486.1 hypothetical protein DU53_04110 [Kosmotoga sp. DU53]